MDADADRSDGSLLADVSGSARGWHGVQLAVLAFIGVLLTYVAVAVMALAASSSWWPTPASSSGDGAIGANVGVTDGSGRTACGELVDGPAARIRLATARGTVEIATTGVADISPVDAC